MKAGLFAILNATEEIGVKLTENYAMWPGAAVSGFEQTTRVNEPGRTLWLKASAKFE